MWKRFLSTLTHLQVQDNTLKYTCIYIEKIPSTSSQAQRHSPGIFKYSTEIIWIEIINQWSKSCTGQIHADPCLPHFWTGFHLCFLSSVLLDHRDQTCVRHSLDPLKTHLNQHNVHAERKHDGELMSSFRTHVPIITFQGSISVETLLSLIYCCECWHIAGYNLYAAAEGAGVWFTLLSVFVLSKSPWEA